MRRSPGRSSVAPSVRQLAELMVERAHRLLGGADHRPVDVGALLDDRDRLDAVDARLEAAAQIAIAALRAVDVRDMDLDVGDPILEAGEALADLLFEAGVAIIVARDLVVGAYLDEHCLTPSLALLVNAGRGLLFR